MKRTPEFVDVHLTKEAALVLTHWLTTVPDTAIPVTHPADRQALADLLFALEEASASPSAESLELARSALLVDGGQWTHEGPIWPGASDIAD